MGAVRVHIISDSQRIRRDTPERVIGSRMVRRWKRTVKNKTFSKIAKSRWCVLGHQDPDTEVMGNESYAPTPCNEALMVFSANRGRGSLGTHLC